MLMHLQASVEGYDVFAAVAVHRRRDDGDAVRPGPADARPLLGRRTTSSRPTSAHEVVTIGRLVNAFFRWEFNSCETLVKGGDVYPIDYANACPDVAVTSPALLLPVGDEGAGEVVGVLRRRPAGRPRPYVDTRRYSTSPTGTTCPTARSWPPTARWPTTYFDTERYAGLLRRRGCRTSTSSCSSTSRAPDFDQLLVDTVTTTFPAHEHDQFIAHFRGPARRVGDRRAPPAGVRRTSGVAGWQSI